MKRCYKCKTEKDETAFYKRKRSSDGFSCICKQCDKEYIKQYDATPRGKEVRRASRRKPKARYGVVKFSSKKRGYEWSLTFDEWHTLVIGKTCHYCWRDALPLTGCALDRKDNTLGYCFDNCVPCCDRCNQVKGAMLTYDKFMLVAPVLRKIDAIEAEQNHWVLLVVMAHGATAAPSHTATGATVYQGHSCEGLGALQWPRLLQTTSAGHDGATTDTGRNGKCLVMEPE